MALILVVRSVSDGALKIGNPIIVPVAVPVSGAVPTGKGFEAEEFLYHGNLLPVEGLFTTAGGGQQIIIIYGMLFGGPMCGRLSEGGRLLGSSIAGPPWRTCVSSGGALNDDARATGRAVHRVATRVARPVPALAVGVPEPPAG